MLDSPYLIVGSFGVVGVVVVAPTVLLFLYTVAQVNATVESVEKQVRIGAGRTGNQIVNIPPYVKSINGKFKLFDFMMTYFQHGVTGIAMYLICYIIGKCIDSAPKQPASNRGGGFLSETKRNLRTMKHIIMNQQQLYNEKIRCNLMSATCRNKVNLWQDKYVSDARWKVEIFDNHVFGYHRELRYCCCGLRRVFKAVPLQFSDYCEAKLEDFTGCQFPVAWLFVIFGIVSGLVALGALRRRDEVFHFNFK